MGRPSLYTPELIDEICARLETGETLNHICDDDGMPTARTVQNWKDNKPEVYSAIAHAREIGFDVIANNCLAIADAPNTVERPDGTIETRDPQRDKLRVWTRLQLLAKWDPKRYGDAMTLKGDRDNPLVQMAPERLEGRLIALLTKIEPKRLQLVNSSPEAEFTNSDGDDCANPR